MTFRETDAFPEVATTVSVYEPGAGPDVAGLLTFVPLPHADAVRHPESASSIARCAKRKRPNLNCVNNSPRRANAITGIAKANIASSHGIGELFMFRRTSVEVVAEFTIKFRVAVIWPVTGRVGGEIAQVEPVGAPEQVNETVPAKFGIDVNCMPSWLDWPGTSATVLAVGAIVNGAVADPVKLIVCGESGASSTIVTFAVRVPTACGLNVTVVAQFAFTASVAAQVFVCAKSPGFGPASAMLEMCKVPVPEFVSVNP